MSCTVLHVAEQAQDYGLDSNKTTQDFSLFLQLKFVHIRQYALAVSASETKIKIRDLNRISWNFACRKLVYHCLHRGLLS